MFEQRGLVVIDVSGQPIGPHLQDHLTLEDWTDRLSRNVRNLLQVDSE